MNKDDLKSTKNNSFFQKPRLNNPVQQYQPRALTVFPDKFCKY